MFGTLLIGCAFLSSAIDAIIVDRDKGVTEQHAREKVIAGGLPTFVERKVLGAINLLYLRSHVSDASRRDQLLLSCNNPEVIRGNQHSRQRRER